MIQICVFPNCNRDAGDYDAITPENSTLRVGVHIENLNSIQLMFFSSCRNMQTGKYELDDWRKVSDIVLIKEKVTVIKTSVSRLHVCNININKKPNKQFLENRKT